MSLRLSVNAMSRATRQPTEAEIRVVVGQQLRGMRELRGLSLRKAAVLLGISYSHLGQIERAQRGASLEILFRASRVYRVNLDVLLGREPLPGGKRGKRILDAIAAAFRQPSLQDA